MLLLGYFAIALAALGGLTWMILAISRALGTCPVKGAAIRAAGVTIATGYLAIGGGAVLLIGAFATLQDHMSTMAFSAGLACVVLGLGFTQAATMLRAIVDKPAKTEPAPPVMEPVLA